MALFIRNAFNYDKRENSLASALVIPDDPEVEQLTKQEFKEECDINVLLRRFAITGQMPKNVRMPVYGDFDQINDFHSAVNAIALASEAFEQMPADIRSRFQNDPEAFTAFCLDERNRPEAERWGLVKPPPKVDPPVETPAAPNAPASSTAAPPAGGPAAKAAV